MFAPRKPPLYEGPGPRCRSAAGATNRHQMARPSASQATQSDAERRRVLLLGWVADAEHGSANPIFPEHRFNASNLTPNTLQHLETFKERSAEANVERYRALQRETPDYMEPLGLSRSGSPGQRIQASLLDS